MPPVPNSRTTDPRRRIRRAGLPLALTIGLLLLAGCSSAKDGGDSASGVVAPDVGEPADRDSAPAEDEAVGGGGETEQAPADGTVPENAPPGSATLTEQIVRTGDVSVEVDDITEAANRVTAVVSGAGGDVGSDQRYGNAEDGGADLVVRVPPDRFNDVLETVGGLGEELTRSVSAEDVSTIVADVDARVRSLQNSVDRLLALAAQAVSIGDLIAVEYELSARQSELESLQAQQRALADQVSLATLSVRLTASSEPEDADDGFLASLKNGWEALVNTGGVVISVLGLILPWLILLLVLFVPLWMLIRRRRPAAALANTAVTSGDPVSEPAASAPSRLPE
ncbi:MAG: DUF4349 domain-containing protein [Actinomycetota bacterium]|nr:DUF4349 domain-containing protein [Actinomycetota bacterium]